MNDVQFEKRSTPILKSKDWKPDTEIMGVFMGLRTRQVFDRNAGVNKDITDYLLEQPDKSILAVSGNVGLKTAFSDARVEEGELIKIKKLEKQDLGNGKTVNNYEILVAKKH